MRNTFFIMLTRTVKSVGNGQGMLPHSETSPGHQNSRVRIIFRIVPSMGSALLHQDSTTLCYSLFHSWILKCPDFRDSRLAIWKSASIFYTRRVTADKKRLLSIPPHILFHNDESPNARDSLPEGGSPENRTLQDWVLWMWRIVGQLLWPRTL